MALPDGYKRGARILVSAMALLLLLSAKTTFAANGSVTYTYDALGRLLTATYDTGVTITYTYDANGNRTSQTITVGTSTVGTWNQFLWGNANW